MSPSDIPYDNEQLSAGISPRQGAGSHDANDPTTWDVYASSGLVIGLDIGQMSPIRRMCWQAVGHRRATRSASSG